MINSTKSGIYRIENQINRKVYVGQAGNLNKRYCDHVSALRRNNHDNSYLQRAWNKYEEKDFVFSILEECPAELLAQKEQYWMDRTQCYIREYGYNINPSSTKNPMLGRTHSKETKAKLSKLAKGRKMSKENFDALMQANKNVAKPPKNLEKRTIKAKTPKRKSYKYEYHIIKPCGEYIMLNKLDDFCYINRCSLTHLRGLIFKNKFYKGWTAIAIPLKPKPSKLLPQLKLQTILQIKQNYA